jgi:hypothetical protein
VLRGVLVLVDDVHGGTGLEEDLRALQLAVAAGEVEASPSFRGSHARTAAELQGRSSTWNQRGCPHSQFMHGDADGWAQDQMQSNSKRLC